MTHQQQTLVNDVLNLPLDAQRRVADLVAALKEKQSPTTPASGDLANDPFIGLWKERQDLTDSGTWVRNLRKGEW